MNIAELMRTFGLTSIVGLDAETYYASDYTLRGLSTTEYITDLRFALHCMAVQDEAGNAAVMSRDQFVAFVKRVDWSKTGVLCHHAHFDGLILSHHFGVHPKMFFDTLSMARPVMPITVSRGLDPLAKAFGFQGKVRGQALLDTKGKRELTMDEYDRLTYYAGDDIADTWRIFEKLLPFYPEDELRLIDVTVRMYTAPTVRINGGVVDALHTSELTRKDDMLKKLRVSRTQLGSTEQFRVLLEREGVELPTKISKRTNKEAFATAKNDLAFQALLKHPRKRVRDLVEARLAIKGMGLENRAKKMHARSSLGAQPIYLNYAGAHTMRWSGGDKINWQNMNRGSDLRKSVEAPPGYKFVISDQSQIEARLNAYRAKQDDVVEAFRLYDKGKGPDIYKKTAAEIIYRKALDAITKEERFVGKTCELGLGFQAGWQRFADMLRSGQFGPPMQITDDQSRVIVSAWRQAKHRIVACWRETQNVTKSAFCGGQAIEYGLTTFEGAGKHGFIHMPNGMSLRYDFVEMDEEGSMSYVSKVRRTREGDFPERTKLYGGIITENVVQALSRVILAAQMAYMAKHLPDTRIVTCTHDEVLLLVPKRAATRRLRDVIDIMSVPPKWAPGLPLSVSAKVSAIYDKE